MNLRVTCTCILATLLASSDLASGAWRYRRQDDEPPSTDAPAPAPGGTKMCVKCADKECVEPRTVTMNCASDKMSSLVLEGASKEVWENVTAGIPDFDDPTKYTHCFNLLIKDTLDVPQGEVRGCIPGKIGEGDNANEVCGMIMDKIGSNVTCHSCEAAEETCNNDTSPYDKPKGKGGCGRTELNFCIFFWVFSAALMKLLM